MNFFSPPTDEFRRAGQSNSEFNREEAIMARSRFRKMFVTLPVRDLSRWDVLWMDPLAVPQQA